MLGENQNQNKILEVKNSIAETMGRYVSGPDVAEERMSEYWGRFIHISHTEMHIWKGIGQCDSLFGVKVFVPKPGVHFPEPR